MKKGMCKGCDNLLSVDQWIFFDTSGTRRLKKPYTLKKPYCKEYTLHLDYVDRLIEVQSGNGICPRYISGGIS